MPTSRRHRVRLLTDRLDRDLIVEVWPDLLRMAGSLKFGQATASLIVGKWHALRRDLHYANQGSIRRRQREQ